MRGRREAGRVDLDDGQVGQGVDAVDRAGQDPAVLELDVELLAAFDDVMVGQDPAVAVEDDAGADAGLGDDPVVAVVGRAGHGDPDDGRADLRGDRDRRRLLVDRDRLERTDVGPLGDGGRRRRGRPIEGAGRAQREDGATGREHGGQERGGQQRAAAGPLARRDGDGAGGHRRRGRLVPALGGHRRGLVPGPGPVAAGLGARRETVEGRIGRRGRARRGRPRIDRGAAPASSGWRTARSGRSRRGSLEWPGSPAPRATRGSRRGWSA